MTSTSSGRRVWAIARRIVEQFLRDERSLALILLAPVLILGLLGVVMRNSAIPVPRVAILNLDLESTRSERVRAELAEAIGQARFPMVDLPPDEASGDGALVANEVDVVVVLPVGFGAELAVGDAPPLSIVTQGMRASDEAAQVELVLRQLSAALPLPTGGASILRRSIFGPPTFLGPQDALITFAPALIGSFVFFSVLLLTAFSFRREWNDGTLERLLATPVRRAEIVAGYSIGYGVFATIQVVLILAFSLSGWSTPDGSIGPRIAVGLGVPSAGSPMLVFLVLLLLAIGAMSLGLFLSTLARTERQVLQVIPLLIVPHVLLTGLFWSVASLPPVLQPIARLMPLTYGLDGLRDVMVRGADVSSGTLQLDLAVLAGAAALFAVLTAATIRREVA